MDVDLRWHGAAAPADAALAAHVASVTSADAALVRTGRHCPHCGSGAHGRPWATVHDGPGVQVSLSRAGGHLVTAAALASVPIGVDIEVVADVEARWDPTLVLHPEDPADLEPAWAWCAKEAVLKAAGTGLRVPMTSVRLADYDVRRVEAPPGLCGAVAQAPGSGGSST